MIGMAATMPDFVHGLNLFLEGDYVVDKPKPDLHPKEVRPFP
jgi:hypothetical protein